MSRLIFVTLAGHGGADSGAANPFRPNLPEKTINLLIDSEFARMATLNGHTVHRLRTGDYNISLNDIYPKAIEVGANVVFEFHCDAVSDSSGNGCHAIVLNGSPGQWVGLNLAANIQVQTGIRSMGTKNYFYGNSPTPIYTSDVTRFVQLADRIHTMTESGFVTNLGDESILESSEGQRLIAWSHLAAVHEYYGFPAPALYGSNGSGVVAGVGAFILAAGMFGLAVKTGKTNKPAKGKVV